MTEEQIENECERATVDDLIKYFGSYEALCVHMFHEANELDRLEESLEGNSPLYVNDRKVDKVKLYRAICLKKQEKAVLDDKIASIKPSYMPLKLSKLTDTYND